MFVHVGAGVVLGDYVLLDLIRFDCVWDIGD